MRRSVSPWRSGGGRRVTLGWFALGRRAHPRSHTGISCVPEPHWREVGKGFQLGRAPGRRLGPGRAEGRGSGTEAAPAEVTASLAGEESTGKGTGVQSCGGGQQVGHSWCLI